MTALTRLNTDEILRYMGCPPERADAGLRAQVEDCAGELLGVVRPRWRERTVELSFEAGGVRLENGLLLPGEDLKRHLAGCGRAAVFCNTGCRMETIQNKLAVCDGAVVGTTFKAGGSFRARVDAGRVAEFMSVVRGLRRTGGAG